MYQHLIKPKNIIKIVLSVMAVWLISVAVRETFSSYMDLLEYNEDEAFEFGEGYALEEDYTLSEDYAPNEDFAFEEDHAFEEDELLDSEESEIMDEGIFETAEPEEPVALVGGLYGFYGEYALRDDETPVQVTLTFSIPPVVALRMFHDIPDDEAMLMVEGEQALFMLELEALLGESGLFEIHSMYQNLHNGATVTVPSNSVRMILDFESVVRIDRYVLVELPNMPGSPSPLLPDSSIEIVVTSYPESGTEVEPTMILQDSEIIYTVTLRNISEEAVTNIQFTEEISIYLAQTNSILAFFNEDDAEIVDGFDRISSRVIKNATSPEGWSAATYQWEISRLEPDESFTMIFATTVREGVQVGSMIHSILGNDTFHVVGEVASNPSYPSDSSSNFSNPSIKTSNPPSNSTYPSNYPSTPDNSEQNPEPPGAQGSGEGQLTLPQTGAVVGIAGLTVFGGIALLSSGLTIAGKKKTTVEKLSRKDALSKKYDDEYNEMFGGLNDQD